MIQDCVKKINTRKDEEYAIALLARQKGLDPTMDVEIHQAEDLASRVDGLVGPPGCAQELRDASKEFGRDKAAFMIMDSILAGKYGKQEDLKLAEQAVRTAITLLTEGIVVAGTEGIARLEINKNGDGSNYLSIFFASPIRSAGGTAGGQATMLADYCRKKIGVGEYKPTEKELDRYVEEVNLYENEFKLQYKPSEEELKYIVRNCPVCVDGDQTSKTEVSINKNVERVKTNNLRGGACLVLGESIAQKKAKLLKFSKKMNLGWDWLEGMIKVVKSSGEKYELKPEGKYLDDLVGGRPIFAYPSKPGGFRLRYGRARNTGINSRAIHPSTMYILDEFAAIATQFKVERPKKGCAVTPCDSIEPPVVLMKNGDVIRMENIEKARNAKLDVKEILFLGDMLVSYGDFLNANHPLIPSGICEDWWELMADKIGLFVDPYKVTQLEAIKYAKEKGLPLHPAYTYFYADVSKMQIIELVKWLRKAEVESLERLDDKKTIRRLKIANSEEKRILELLCIPHKLRDGFVIIEEPEALEETLALRKDTNVDAIEAENSLDLVNKLAGFIVANKAPVYIGARMGRPEKAKERLMSPAPHGLFPVGEYGGKTRSIERASEKEKIVIDMPKLVCPKCSKTVTAYICPDCGERTELKRICLDCNSVGVSEKCMKCGGKTNSYNKAVYDLKTELQKALVRLNEPMPDRVKGVIGTVNADKYFEPLEKVILRAKHEVFSFKDGTARFDASNIPITHVKPYEIQVPWQQLVDIGYTHDYKGKPLTRDDQIVELWPQDILVSERGAEYMTKVANFLDDLFEKYYGMPRYYNIKKKQDLVGQLVIGMAPHISAGSLGRIVGFTRARGFYAHPFFHCACRRDADGDEDSIMLLMDALLNFSKKFIPSRAGGTEDIPLILSTVLNPTEIDDQAHDIEMINRLPLEFYEATLKFSSAADVDIPIVKDKLGSEAAMHGLGFMFDTKYIDEGPTASQYTLLKTMQEKVDRQLSLARRIRAVDEKDVALRVLNFHFIRDIYGNLRSFGEQTFRCVDCNEKYRRIPLSGKCTKCAGGKILLTIHKGGIEKYLQISQDIVKEYGLGDYMQQRLKLVERDLVSIRSKTEEAERAVEKENKKQQSLADFM